MAKIKRKKPGKTQLITWLAIGLICFSAGTVYGRYLQKSQQAATAQLMPETQQQQAQPASAQPQEPAAEKEPPLLTVDIKGAVKQPGLYYLAEGNRIADAIEAAGLMDNANTDNINQAMMITDAMEIIIPFRQEGEETDWQALAENSNTAKTAKNSSAAINNKPVNINTATLTQLQTLTGIGPAKAQAIIDYRQQNGNFNRPEDIKKVSGIGDATYNNIKDNITVE